MGDGGGVAFVILPPLDGGWRDGSGVKIGGGGNFNPNREIPGTLAGVSVAVAESMLRTIGC